MRYISEEFVIIRTPYYPFKKLFQIDIMSLLTNTSFKEAIFLSSPSLIDEIEKYLNHTVNEKESEKLLLSIYRFCLRAAYRCTPFGLFAGISLGKISDKTAISLCSQELYKKNIRLDTHFMSAVAQKILQEPLIRNSVKWFSNNTIYTVHEKLRYIEYRVDKNSRTHHLAVVDSSEYVQLVLERARTGATISEIIEILITDEITTEEATSFVEEMIAGCLLSPDVEPLVTGKEYHHQLLEKLLNHSKDATDLENLVSIINSLSDTKDRMVGDSFNHLRASLKTLLLDDLNPFPSPKEKGQRSF